MKRTQSINMADLRQRIMRDLGSVFVCLLLLLCGWVTPVVASADPLHDAADSFLELIDAGSYQQAWWEGSELLQLTTDMDTWIRNKRVQRDLLGSFEQRSVRTVVFRQALSGFPDGEYGVLVMECRFEKKQKGLEILSLGKDPYDQWRVISYDLR